jgi:hypothetical protein
VGHRELAAAEDKQNRWSKGREVEVDFPTKTLAVIEE